VTRGGTEEGQAAARFLVSGRVQGVGFRWWVAREAIAVGVAGWARNLADGRVEVVARGDRTALATLEQLLGRGPRISRVDNVEKFDAPHDLSNCKSFDIK
jgi:acylphosphatase